MWKTLTAKQVKTHNVSGRIVVH